MLIDWLGLLVRPPYKAPCGKETFPNDENGSEMEFTYDKGEKVIAVRWMKREKNVDVSTGNEDTIRYRLYKRGDTGGEGYQVIPVRDIISPMNSPRFKNALGHVVLNRNTYIKCVATRVALPADDSDVVHYQLRYDVNKVDYDLVEEQIV